MTWTEDWAKGKTAEERHNLRSWGLECPDPPPPAPHSHYGEGYADACRGLSATGQAILREAARTKHDFDQLYGVATVLPLDGPMITRTPCGHSPSLHCEVCR